MATNMYRVGDYVYVETSSNGPYLIRRIEELNKNQTGNVEAKVMCFYRRRDLPNPLVQLADKHQPALDEELRTSPVQLGGSGGGSANTNNSSSASNSTSNTTTATTTTNTTTNPSSNSTNNNSSSSNNNSNANTNNGGSPEKGEPSASSLTSKQRYMIKHRELFLSRQVESLPATQIRGRCSVTLLNETESLQSYLNKDDTFFYCLVFDPNQKTLLADKGEIRVGSRYQSEIPARLKNTATDERKLEELETLIWTPQHSLTDRKIDQFLVVSRSIGTFARALDCSSSVKQPSLHMSAAAASRDITLFHAMDILHAHRYSVEEAMCSLVPSTGPVLCRDEIEDWSASEANLFEEALDKYGKDFNDIRQDFLPWKTLKQIIEYYYMWKTTDRYVQQKRVKAVEAELKLKQVYIPQYSPVKGGGGGTTIKGGASIYNGTTNGGSGGVADYTNNGKPCESCAICKSTQWFPWTTTHTGTSRLCQQCWDYWKKYGGLKNVKFNDVSSETSTGGTGGGSGGGGASGGGTGGADVKKKPPLTLVEVTAAATVGGVSSAPPPAEEEKVSDLSNRQLHKCSIVNCGKEFKLKTHLARHYAQAHGIAISSGSPRPIMKTRTAFYLHTTAMTRLARIVCRSLIRTRKAARQTSFAINTQLVRQEFAVHMNGKLPSEVKKLFIIKTKDRGSVTKIANRLGSPGVGPHEWLVLTPKDQMPLPNVVSFPKPPKAADGSLLYERIPNKIIEVDKDLTILPATPAGVGAPTAAQGGAAAAATSLTAQRKRPLEDQQHLNGTEITLVPAPVAAGGPPPTKRPNKDPMPSHCPSPEQFAAMMAASGQPLSRHHLNGKPKIAQMARTGNGRKQVISWMDAPDDVYFRANDGSKKARRVLAPIELRRAARKPWRNLPHLKNAVPPPPLPPAAMASRPIESQVVILD